MRSETLTDRPGMPGDLFIQGIVERARAVLLVLVNTAFYVWLWSTLP